MIRYIHLGDQINEGADEFAFYDTIPGAFVEIAGSVVFSSRRDLEEALQQTSLPADRFLSKLPEPDPSEPPDRTPTAAEMDSMADDAHSYLWDSPGERRGRGR